MMRIAFVFIPLFNIIPSFAQFTPIIRGNIVDNVLNEPIAFANVVVLNTHPSLSATTDSLGNFTLNAVPIGRYDLQVTCAGYEPTVIREVILASFKEKLLTIKLKQQVTQLNEIEIKPHISKQNPLHAGATLSAKMLSVEEAKRYAGSFDDPARLVSAFAGVSSNVGNNAVRVRGNSPQSLQWKLEGIEIPNPNHMADLRALGGGTVTALSAQLLANSDFFTGAMPAEYSNALSGVFDMSMRKGNNQKHEQTLQIGVVGIDAAAEG
ncbi:MAG: carboxypeptidase-like regulatory domain-containing protein, partial [Sphingobacteriaceae bacterium]